MNQNSFLFYATMLNIHTLRSMFLFLVTVNLPEMNNKIWHELRHKNDHNFSYNDPMKLGDPLFCWKFQALSNENKIRWI